MAKSNTKLVSSISIQDQVQEYYGRVLQSNKDLKTSACCPIDALPAYLRPLLANIDDEIQQKFYGCGSPLPFGLQGCTVLDLGCGTGRDVYLASQLVGPNGFVHGVDMTAEQLEVARRLSPSQAQRFGYSVPNVMFHQGYIEDLASLGLQDESVDVVISNCVLNLSPAKEQVFAEILRVLKPGGELYFSDVFADRRIPKELMNDDVLLGECLAGAMYYEDFRRLLAALGVADVRTLTTAAIDVLDADIVRKVGAVKFESRTVRAFKLETLEDRCEDFGQVAIYRGGIDEAVERFILDDHHVFERNKPVLVCGNTAAMLQQTRYGAFFEIIGDTSQHFGLFPCAPVNTDTSSKSAACC